MDAELEKCNSTLASYGINIEELKKSLVIFANKIKEILKKVWSIIKKFIIENKEVIEKVYYMFKKNEKYKKRVSNRQALYLKKKSLGKKL